LSAPLVGGSVSYLVFETLNRQAPPRPAGPHDSEATRLGDGSYGRNAGGRLPSGGHREEKLVVLASVESLAEGRSGEDRDVLDTNLGPDLTFLSKAVKIEGKPVAHIHG